ncbi:MAG TPA: PDZ domain-containing protein [Verrucomicrobiae bacterium]|nr:PDZ domain-containing protein [Verrucomicrobiae bacterium]
MRFPFNVLKRKVGPVAGVLSVGLLVLFFWWKESQRPPTTGHELALTTANDVGQVSNSASSSVMVAFPTVAPPIDDHGVVGIGVALVRPNVANGVAQIDRVLPDSPAEQAGLMAGMNVHKVDGIPLRGLSLPETTRLIRGPAGSTVQLELYYGVDGEKFTVEVTRQKLKL